MHPPATAPPDTIAMVGTGKIAILPNKLVASSTVNF